MPSNLEAELTAQLAGEARAGRLSRRELFVRGSVLGLGATSLGTILAACGGSDSGSSKGSSATAGGPARRGGTVRVSSSQPAAALDPVTMFDAGAIALVQQVAEYLAWVEPDLRLRPVLAEKWTPSADAKTWTFDIRRGVSFQDGTPLTADDVVATFDRLIDPKSQSAALSNFSGILSKGNVTKSGSHKVVFTLDRAFVDFPYIVSSANYNAVILPKAYDGGWEKTPVGTGPFTLERYVSKRSASLKRNAKYWQQGLPYLDAVEFAFAEDVQAEVLSLQGLKNDLMVTTPLQGTQALAHNSAFQFSNLRSSGHNALSMRVDKPPFDDVRVRQALALAVEREQMLKVLYQGRGSLGNDTVFAPAFPNAPKLPQRAVNVAKAKQLLAAAGHPRGFKATLSTERASEVPAQATLFQQAWKAIGVDVALDIQSQSAYYGSGDNQPWLEVPVGLVDWASRPIPAQFLIPAYTSKGIWNSAHWHDAQFDTLVQRYDGELDQGKRMQLATQLAKLQSDQVPAILPVFSATSRVYSKKLRGPVPQQTNALNLTRVSLISS